MLDADLAEIYNVTTKRLNEQVKRNAERFPEDFAFRLTEGEKTELVANCDRFDRLKHSTVFPLVFTEHGAIMAAHRGLAQRLNELETKYDAQFQVVFDAIRALMEPPKTPRRRRIGF